MWLTVIFRSLSKGTPYLGLKRFTCRPTLIFFVSAPSGKIACTWGTTVLDTIPPSGPMACTSCRILDTTAKYCGKSWVTMRVMRPEETSSIWLRSENKFCIIMDFFLFSNSRKLLFKKFSTLFFKSRTYLAKWFCKLKNRYLLICMMLLAQQNKYICVRFFTNFSFSKYFGPSLVSKVT